MKKSDKIKGNKNAERKGLKLTPRLMIMAFIPMLLIFVVAILSVRTVCGNVIETMVKHELNAAQYAFEVSVENLATGTFMYTNNKFYKGKKNISENPKFFDNFSENIDLQVTVFYGDTRVATSLVDEIGERMVGTTADPEIYDAVVNQGQDYYSDEVTIAGKDYYAMYCPLYQTNSDEIIGMTFVGLDKSEVLKIYNSNLAGSIVILCIILLQGVILTAISIKTVSKSIISVVKDFNRIAEGKLNTRADHKLTSRADEVGDISISINKLSDGLTEIVTNIKGASTALGDISSNFSKSFGSMTDSIGNVDKAVEGISRSTTHQADDTAQVGYEVQNMGDAIETTAHNIDTLVGNAEKMREYNKSVGISLDELTKISDETQNAFEVVFKQTNLTNQSAQDIQSAADVITDIADQTSLLSLNASIEAARAGEHGKGFAVVADEIKKLAEQSAESASQIRGIIEMLITNSTTTVNTMNNVTEVMEKQGQEIEKTRTVFNSLNSEISEVSGAVDNIRGEVDKLNELKTTVLDSVQNLAAIAEENAASTEETSASMQELRQAVKDCDSEVGRILDTSKGLSDDINVFEL